jgi:16S rRNA (guanine527-N7)-methyltransferase
MTSTPAPIADRFAARAATLSVNADPRVLAKLGAYFELLQRWNEKINLTSLGDTDEAVDRLVMEPLVAASFLPHNGRLVDIGSGGGSPAIPLAIALNASHLTMIESRGRKAAFLREALRVLDLPGSVESDRAETLANSAAYEGTAQIVSVRAVRMTSQLSAAVAGFLVGGGILALFSKHSELIPDGFKPAGAHALVPATQSYLHCFRRSSDVPRGTP